MEWQFKWIINFIKPRQRIHYYVQNCAVNVIDPKTNETLSYGISSSEWRKIMSNTTFSAGNA